jgi:hypothetical protein
MNLDNKIKEFENLIQNIDEELQGSASTYSRIT